jgi:hypothetical protein
VELNEYDNINDYMNIDHDDHNIDGEYNYDNYDNNNLDKYNDIKHLSRLDCGIPLMYNGFDIFQSANNHYIKIMESKNRTTDGDTMLLNSTLTKAELAKKFAHIFSMERVNEKTQCKIFDLLSSAFPSIDWPVSKVNGNVYLKLENYVGKDYRTLSFDACPHSCTVFHWKTG